MTNEVFDLVKQETIAQVKTLIAKQDIEPADTQAIVSALEEKPTLLNHLSLEEVSKLSVLGVDLSRYMSAVHMNNIKVFVVKFASDSMMRVSKLIDLLNKVETRYYNSVLNNASIHPRVAADMIEKIQESITASVNLMMKLTDNETLMNLFIVNMTNINDSISEGKQRGVTSSVELLPLESRKKIDRMVAMLAQALEETPQESEAVEAEFVEKESED